MNVVKSWCTDVFDSHMGQVCITDLTGMRHGAFLIRKPYVENVRQLVNIACPNLFTILVIGKGGFV